MVGRFLVFISSASGFTDVGKKGPTRIDAGASKSRVNTKTER